MAKKGNYCAFYVDEPFKDCSSTFFKKDFCYYELLRAWKKGDNNFPFIDSHDFTYNVRDDSDWESTLKPRLHERLSKSKNVVLFLSTTTKNSRALKEEIDFAINKLSLPIIVVYPELELCDISEEKHLSKKVKSLWNNLPIFRDNMNKVSTIHIPFDKFYLAKALLDEEYDVDTFIYCDASFYY